MSDKLDLEHDYIIITIEESDDEGDNEVVIIEDSETENTDNRTPNDVMLAIEPNPEDNGDDSLYPVQIDDVAGFPVLDDPAASHMSHLENLKRCNPVSDEEEEEFTPLCKRGRPSSPRENNRGLANLIQIMSGQVNHLYEIIANIQQHSCNERLLTLSNEDMLSSFLIERQGDNWIHSLGALLHMVLPELQEQQPGLEENPSFPRIVTTHSLHTCLPGSNLCALPYLCNEDAENASHGLLAQDSAVVPTHLLAEQLGLENTFEMTYDSTLLENSSDPDAASSLHMFEMPEKEESSQEYNIKAIYYPTLPANKCGQDSTPNPVFLLRNLVPGAAENDAENNPRPVSHSNAPGDQCDEASSTTPIGLPPNFLFERLILIERPENAETRSENNPQTSYFPALLGSISGPDTDISSIPIPPDFAFEKVVVIDAPESAEASPKNNSETECSPTVLKNDSDPELASSSHATPPSCEPKPEMKSETPAVESDNNEDSEPQDPMQHCFKSCVVYLGDPRRNVKILDTHLMLAQRKGKPKQAARYLIRVLFSTEVLVCSSVGNNPEGRPPLDPNRMAALREYLAIAFPTHDLRECGKDWRACISVINAVIRCLRLEARKLREQCGLLDPPANPQSPDMNDNRNARRGRSQASQQAAASRARNNDNSQPNSGEGIEGAAGGSIAGAAELLIDYLGNRSRNILVPREFLRVARNKVRPELSARYLIRRLFPEDILVRSNVYGSPEYGMYPLNSNKINALREFLQEVFPTCDLSENGPDWKLCVSAINSSIRSLRYDIKIKKAMDNSQSPAEATSAEPKPKEDDNADKST